MSPLLGTERRRRWALRKLRRKLLALMRHPGSSLEPVANPSAGDKQFAEIETLIFGVWGQLKNSDQRQRLIEFVAVSSRGMQLLAEYYGETLLPRLQDAELARSSAALPHQDADDLDLPAFLRNRRPN